MLGATAGDVVGLALALPPEVREDHTAYIESWLKVLGQDRRSTRPPPTCSTPWIQPAAERVDAAQEGYGSFHGVSPPRRGQHLCVRFGHESRPLIESDSS